MKANLTYLLKLQEGQKAPVRRNLPINVDYKLIDTGTLDSENAITCDNCNKVITSYGLISNNDKNYHVGMDCLPNLLKCNSYSEMYQLAETYAKMQKELRFRSYIRKLKKNNLLKVELTEYGVKIFEDNTHKYNVSTTYWNKLNI